MAKILVLDECPLTRDLLAEELAGEGNVVLALGMPDLIWEEIEVFNPEVAILDLFVKGKYRWDLLTGIKSRKPDLAIILYSWDFPKRTFFPHSIDGFITKSFDLQELKQCIAEVLMLPGIAVNM